VYGCKEEAVVKLVYSKQFEADRRQCRCTTCANYVREQDDTEIKKQELIVDANDLPQEYYDHIVDSLGLTPKVPAGVPIKWG